MFRATITQEHAPVKDKNIEREESMNYIR